MSWMERMENPTFITIIKGLYINQNKWEDVGYIGFDEINTEADTLLINLESLGSDKEDVLYEIDDLFKTIWEENEDVAVDYEETCVHSILLTARTKLNEMEKPYSEEERGE